MTINDHKCLINIIHEKFVFIREHSRSVADKKHEQFRSEKYLRYLCDKKNQREEINQCEIKNQIIMKNKTFWKFAIQTAISVLSAIATALGVTSCMA